MHSFWQHSLACGVIARRIASQRRQSNIERFFVVGLWRFEGAYREAVAYHHSPTLAQLHPIETAAVHVADVIAHGFAWGRSGEPRVPPFEPRA